jgi:sec-independent protein translocase protein TatC
MESPEDPKGAPAPPGESSSYLNPTPSDAWHNRHLGDPDLSLTFSDPADEPPAQDISAPLDPEPTGLEASYIGSFTRVDEPAPPPPPPPPPPPGGGSGQPPKPPDPPDPEDQEESGMARMSFMEHLEELRKRLLLAIGGIGVAFFLCLLFSDELWNVVFGPASKALTDLHVVPPTLKLISPMDTFQIFWMKVPILFAVFLSSPWILYQVWAFIAPGLYKKERRLAAPFVLSSAGLFILGGCFAYFIAFRYGLEFLLGLGMGKGVDPAVNVNEYYDLFVDVMLGVGVVFEIPVLLFLLTLVHIVKPAFLVRHSRYAILVIVIIAAVITPTGDVFNLALFATPMIILFYVGIFASYLLVLHREDRRFPWRTFFKWFGIVILVAAAIAWLVARYYGYHFVAGWPLFVR